MSRIFIVLFMMSLAAFAPGASRRNQPQAAESGSGVSGASGSSAEHQLLPRDYVDDEDANDDNDPQGH